MAAMPRLQPVRVARLVVAGNDMGGGSAARRLAATLGIADRTLFAGLMTGRARLDLLADADVVVYPSADEVFGLVPLEALLCGTPVVVAGDSGCGEIVGGLEGGQVVALGDPAALAARSICPCLAAGLARTGRGGGNQRAGTVWRVGGGRTGRCTVSRTPRSLTPPSRWSCPCSTARAGCPTCWPRSVPSWWVGRTRSSSSTTAAGDQSVEVCRRIGDANLQVIDGPRRGAAAAVNAGLRLARFDAGRADRSGRDRAARLARRPACRAGAIRTWRPRKAGT